MSEEISQFFGITISMHYQEQMPPHFNVSYRHYQAAFSIDHLEMKEGSLPPRVISLVLEWAFIHRYELIENWELAEERKPLKKIDPLE